MFSGIIQSVGKITSFKGSLLVVEAPEIAKNNDDQSKKFPKYEVIS